MTTFYAFRLLPQPEQLAAVWAEGQHLASRTTSTGQAVLLYHLPAGFFAEVWYEPVLNEVVQVRCFVKGEPLAAWAELVRLPE